MYQLAVLLQFGIFGVSHGLKVVRMMNRFVFFSFFFFLYYDHCIQSVCIPGCVRDRDSGLCNGWAGVTGQELLQEHYLGTQVSICFLSFFSD